MKRVNTSWSPKSCKCCPVFQENCLLAVKQMLGVKAMGGHECLRAVFLSTRLRLQEAFQGLVIQFTHGPLYNQLKLQVS